MTRSLGQLIFGQGGIFSVVLGDPALQVADVYVGNDLALFVGGNVVDFVADVHVPVDTFRSAGGGVASARLDQQANLAHGVLLVIGEVGEDFHLATIELFRPVALLAGILRRAQVVNWRGNGTREGVERGGKDLARAGKL